MTSNFAPHTDPAQRPALEHHFAMAFSSTPRGARLARRLTSTRLDTWGIPYDTDVHDAVLLVAAELCVNAATHGRVPGRDFGLRVTADAACVRVEVDDTRSERLPSLPAPHEELTTAGRGLLLVAGLATRWDWHYRVHAPGKTVWAEVARTSRPHGDASTPLYLKKE
ncbi:ATP-binding protein [Streptomyces sp. NPDC048560]|uniref:ATP-binding protein n=1 Tax=Streptomyces sp. NPDC048560 TaxID=3155488 RepID=UPI0034465458